MLACLLVHLLSKVASGTNQRHCLPSWQGWLNGVALFASHSSGTPVLEHHMAVMADASTKSCHYAPAGRSQQGAVATTFSYFAELSRQVLEDHAVGRMTSPAQQAWTQHCATTSGEDGDATCTSNLSCSRVRTNVRGITDSSGTAGLVCAHGMPGRSCFVLMPTSAAQVPHYHHPARFGAAARHPSCVH